MSAIGAKCSKCGSKFTVKDKNIHSGFVRCECCNNVLSADDLRKLRVKLQRSRQIDEWVQDDIERLENVSGNQ